MKLSFWIATRERGTWISLAEALALGLVLYAAADTATHLLLALPLLAHLGYTAVTSLPLGAVPGRPSSAAERRRNYDLRVQVVTFLNEVQRLEKYVQRAHADGLRRSDMEKSLRWAEERIRTTADEVVKVTGRVM